MFCGLYRWWHKCISNCSFGSQSFIIASSPKTWTHRHTQHIANSTRAAKALYPLRISPVDGLVLSIGTESGNCQYRLVGQSVDQKSAQAKLTSRTSNGSKYRIRIFCLVRFNGIIVLLTKIDKQLPINWKWEESFSLLGKVEWGRFRWLDPFSGDFYSVLIF